MYLKVPQKCKAQHLSPHCNNIVMYFILQSYTCIAVTKCADKCLSVFRNVICFSKKMLVIVHKVHRWTEHKPHIEIKVSQLWEKRINAWYRWETKLGITQIVKCVVETQIITNGVRG